MTYDRSYGRARRRRLALFEGAEPALFGLVNRERREFPDKVADMMLETILSDRLNVGDRLPSERELGEPAWRLAPSSARRSALSSRRA